MSLTQTTLSVEDYAGDVSCVRYLLAFTVFSLVGLVVDPLPKFFPGFFIANILWTLAKSPCLSPS